MKSSNKILIIISIIIIITIVLFYFINSGKTIDKFSATYGQRELVWQTGPRQIQEGLTNRTQIIDAVNSYLRSEYLRSNNFFSHICYSDNGKFALYNLDPLGDDVDRIARENMLVLPGIKITTINNRTRILINGVINLKNQIVIDSERMSIGSGLTDPKQIIASVHYYLNYQFYNYIAYWNDGGFRLYRFLDGPGIPWDANGANMFIKIRESLLGPSPTQPALPPVPIPVPPLRWGYINETPVLETGEGAIEKALSLKTPTSITVAVNDYLINRFYSHITYWRDNGKFWLYNFYSFGNTSYQDTLVSSLVTKVIKSNITTISRDSKVGMDGIIINIAGEPALSTEEDAIARYLTDPNQIIAAVNDYLTNV
jgi:hypothetical protein